MKQRSDYYKENLVSFSACKVDRTELLWIDKSNFPECDDVATYFLDKFSYAIIGSELFDSLSFKKSDTRTLYAERYGGAGVGDNGGGVRCGNSDKYQIKGVGKNKLVGEAKEKWHSYGGLNATDAVYEVAISKALNNILPVGTIKYYGVILTGEDKAYDYNEERTHGALLVKEAVLRPAHFLRNSGFKIPKKSSLTFSSDQSRVRSSNKKLLSSFSNNNEFIQFIGRFLSSCANQLAAAKLMRVCHGSITPSNLSIDGRWLDLTNSSFLPSGKNFGGPHPFYEEPKKIIDVVKEWLYTVSKYNSIQLNVEPLINYYFESFEAYFAYHLSFILGLPYDVDEKYMAGKRNLITRVSDTLIYNKTVVTDWPNKLAEDDPVLVLMRSLFVPLARRYARVDSHSFADERFVDCDAVDELEETIGYFYRMEAHGVSFRSFVLRSAMCSFIRILMTEPFYKWRLEPAINDHLEGRTYERITRLVDEVDSLSKWAFNKDVTDNVTIYKDSTCTIEYDCVSETYLYVGSVGRVFLTFHRYMDLKGYVEASHVTQSYAIDFCLKRYISRLGLYITELESMMLSGAVEEDACYE